MKIPLIAKTPLIAGAAVIFVSLALSGCGRPGSLDQPGPMFGAQAKADWDAKKRAEADAAAKAKAKDKDNSEPDRPNPSDPNNPPLAQAPYSTPLPGVNNPFGSAPQGSLPNPGTAPNP
jgi:hypothetical protein